MHDEGVQIGEGLNIRCTQPDRFSNIEMRSRLPFPETVKDYAAFYRLIMSNMENVVNRPISEFKLSDLIQLELIGENARQQSCITYGNDDGAVMTAFQKVNNPSPNPAPIS